jgi:hypothetical protein
VLPPPGCQVRVLLFLSASCADVACLEGRRGRHSLTHEDDTRSHTRMTLARSDEDEDDAHEDNTHSRGREGHSLAGTTLSTSALAQWPSRFVDDDGVAIGCGDVLRVIADVRATSFDVHSTSAMSITRLTAGHRGSPPNPPYPLDTGAGVHPLSVRVRCVRVGVRCPEFGPAVYPCRALADSGVE